jgi:elongation factor G
MEALVAQERERLVETLAEFDDALAEQYLGGEEIEATDLLAAIRKATLALQVVPVLCGSALRNKGIQPLLDAVVDFLPSPEDIPAIGGVNPKTGEKETRASTPRAPFSALVFKIMQDEGRKLSYIRLYSGSIRSGDDVFNAVRMKKEKVSRLLKMHANKRERIDQADAGDIVAVMGLKEARTGDTLCDEAHPILLESMEFYEPVISQAIEAKTPADQERVAMALTKLLEEDPTLRLKYDDETAQTVLSGMGELHLEIIIDRLVREFNAHVNVGKPRVVYRETIQESVDIQKRFEKELGDKRHFGEVRLLLDPLERGSGVEIVHRLDGTQIPEEYFPAIEEGVREALSGGILAGYPMTDLRITLAGGEYREGESSPLGYRVAAATALREGVAQGAPILLEPVMMVDVLTPPNSWARSSVTLTPDVVKSR